MASIGNYSLPYPVDPTIKPPKTQSRANDLHLTAVGGGNADLLGVEGVGTEDPRATFNVEGLGTGAIDITDISVAPGDSLHVRIKHSGNKLPKLKVQWTIDGANAGAEIERGPTVAGRS